MDNSISILITDKKNERIRIVLSKTDLTLDQLSNQILDRVISEPDDVAGLIRTTDETFFVDCSEDSSFVNFIGYNFNTNILTVRLDSGEYEYADVPVMTFFQFVSAGSKGQFYNREIKKKF